MMQRWEDELRIRCLTIWLTASNSVVGFSCNQNSVTLVSVFFVLTSNKLPLEFSDFAFAVIRNVLKEKKLQ